ncbi:conserved hypothetical protein, partial [Trichinella spiralis]|uniref:hypothetical protein n=1 Tax=Trichinella spiralis TaxID=6334 RepID=UPI0001EFEF15
VANGNENRWQLKCSPTHQSVSSVTVTLITGYGSCYGWSGSTGEMPMFYWLAKNRVFIGSLLIASYGVIALVLSPKPGIAKLLLSSNPSGSP